jgi:hypothetical protein
MHATCDLANDLTFPLSEDSPFRSFEQGHDVHIQRHQHQLQHSLERSVCLHGQLRAVRNHIYSAISELAVTYH